MVKNNQSGSTEILDVSSLGNLYVAYRSELVAHARRVLGDSQKSEEIVQESFIRLMLASPELASTEDALPYVKKTITNLSIDSLRSEGRRPSLVVIDENLEKLHTVADSADPVSDQLAAADDAAIIRQALSLLSPAERTALVMWELDGRSTKEIAAELGIKEKAVRHTISRARSSMRRILAEIVIDQERGLTALDLLSTTVRGAKVVIDKGSKVALSVVLVVLAYFGFTGNGNSKISALPTSNTDSAQKSSSQTQVATPTIQTKVQNTTLRSDFEKKTSRSDSGLSNVRSTTMSFPGLDKNGIPTGFTISDSSGQSGSLYFNGKDVVVMDSGLVITSVAKTSSNAANVLLNQIITQDASGLDYQAQFAFGRDNRWVPCLSQVLSVENERLVSGNYLVTAIVQVKSEVVSGMSIPAYAGGRDLQVMPSRVITRILLDSSKSRIIGQAVQVVEKGNR